MKPKKTIVTVQQLADMRGYSDPEKLADEASKAGILFEFAGTPHVCLEDWDDHMQKTAASQLSARSKSGKTLADTDQLGIIMSNLKRLPDIIKKKERRLKAIEALLKDATSDDEIYSLHSEKSTLETDLKRHRENLENAQIGLKRKQAERRALLDESDALESTNSKDTEEGAPPGAEPSKQ